MRKWKTSLESKQMMMKPYKTSDLFLQFLPDEIANLIEGDLR